MGLFYFLAIYKLVNHLWLFQQDPYFFINRFDFITWIFMSTGVHKWPLGYTTRLLVFDIFFYAMPLVWFIINRFNKDSATVAAFVWLIINWIYIQCYTLYPINSIESYLAWLLMPLLFATTNTRQFYFVMHGLRYFFLFFFASAGIWKIRQAGVFNPEELSGILLTQHAAHLISAPGDWQSKLIYYLVRHPWQGYILYATATLFELFFITGFFTRKYDRILIAVFILFLVMDMLVMRIPYFEVLPLVLPLLFSKYDEPRIIK
jgi:hypothetical protein